MAQKRGFFKPPCVSVWIGSVEAHAAEEFNGAPLLIDEPLKSLSENILTGQAVLREDGIEAALGGVGLPATVKQGDEALSDLGNLVAMEADDGHALLIVEINRGVARLPVDALGDRLVHLDFDFAHGVGWVVFL